MRSYLALYTPPQPQRNCCLPMSKLSVVAGRPHLELIRATSPATCAVSLTAWHVGGGRRLMDHTREKRRERGWGGPVAEQGEEGRPQAFLGAVVGDLYTVCNCTLLTAAYCTALYLYELTKLSYLSAVEEIQMPFYKKTKFDKINEKLLIERNKTLERGLYVVLRIVVPFLSIVSIMEPLVSFECDASGTKEYPNPDYRFKSHCAWERHLYLLGMCQVETMLTRRMLLAAVLGGVIGFERRPADRPAGIRTMSLVAIGACLFTITSMFSFQDGPMTWDASRVAAAIPSGVGFLGAGLIWKSNSKNVGDNGEEMEVHQVHGLTTAASVWLSASVGVASAGGLYIISIYSVMLIVLVVKFGPKLIFEQEDAARERNRDIEGRLISRLHKTDSPPWSSFNTAPPKEDGVEIGSFDRSPFFGGRENEDGGRNKVPDAAAGAGRVCEMGTKTMSEGDMSAWAGEERPLLRPGADHKKRGARPATYTD